MEGPHGKHTAGPPASPGPQGLFFFERAGKRPMDAGRLVQGGQQAQVKERSCPFSQTVQQQVHSCERFRGDAQQDPFHGRFSVWLCHYRPRFSSSSRVRRKAFARWEMAFFRVWGMEAKVWPSSGTKNTGS